MYVSCYFYALNKDSENPPIISVMTVTREGTCVKTSGKALVIEESR